MGIPNPGAVKAEIRALESQKSEVTSRQKEQIQLKLSETLDNIAKIRGRISDLRKAVNHPQIPPGQKAQIRAQLSYLNRQMQQLEAVKKRLFTQREAVEFQVGEQFNQAIAMRRSLLTRLAGMQFRQAVGDEVKGRKG